MAQGRTLGARRGLLVELRNNCYSRKRIDFGLRDMIETIEKEYLLCQSDIIFLKVACDRGSRMLLKSP